MHEEFVQKYFLDNPGSTAARFKDYAVKKAMNEGQDIEEVALQYADINKIKQIMMKQKKSLDPDGSGIGYLKRFGESVGESFNDKYLFNCLRKS